MEKEMRVCGYLEYNGIITKIHSLRDVEKWLGNTRNGDVDLIQRIELMNSSRWDDPDRGIVKTDKEGVVYKYFEVSMDGEQDLCLVKGCKDWVRSCKPYDNTVYVCDSSFSRNPYLETIFLPDSIKVLGEYAFYNCLCLKEVRMPAGLKMINKGCFEGCESIEELRLPEGLMFIEDDAFAGCKGLKKIYLPGSIKRIGCDIFGDITTDDENAKNLEIVIPYGMEEKFRELLPEELHNSIIVEQ